MILKNIDKNYLIILFSLSLSAILSFLTNIFLVRYLGPYNYGVFSGCITIAIFFGSISVLGLDGFLQNVFGYEKNKANRWVPSTYKLIITIILINIVFLIFWSFYGPHDSLTKNILIIFSLFMIGHAILDLVKTIYQINGSYLKLSFFQIYPNLFRFVFILYLYFFYKSFELINIVTIYTLINLSIILLSLPILIKFNSKNFQTLFDKQKNNFKKKINITIHELIKKSKNYIKSKIFFLIYFYMDIILIKYLIGDLNLGYYNAAYILILGSLLFTDAFLKLYTFRYYYYSKHKPKYFKKIFDRGNIFLGIISLLIVLFLVLFSNIIINIFFGFEYSNSIKILIILSLMIPFRFLFTNLAMALRTLNYASYEAKNLRNVVLIKFIISIYMIIEYGIIGAAISAVVCEAILFLMCYYSVKKLIFYN